MYIYKKAGTNKLSQTRSSSLAYGRAYCDNREFKQIATAGATTAAVTEKVWGEYVSVVCLILAKRVTKMSETWTKEFKIYFI